MGKLAILTTQAFAHSEEGAHLGVLQVRCIVATFNFRLLRYNLGALLTHGATRIAVAAAPYKVLIWASNRHNLNPSSFLIFGCKNIDSFHTTVFSHKSSGSFFGDSAEQQQILMAHDGTKLRFHHTNDWNTKKFFSE